MDEESWQVELLKMVIYGGTFMAGIAMLGILVFGWLP